MRDITQLHPDLQAKITELIKACDDKGLAIKITECLRTVAEQDDLYAQGRTKPGKIVTNAKGSSYSSQHQWGIAFDFCQNVKGKEFDNSNKFFNQVGEIAKSLGLGWGGDWTSFVDLPHIYIKTWGSTTSSLKQKYITPDNFFKTWSKVNPAPEKKTYSGGFPRPILKKGSKGVQVGKLQNFLNWYFGKKVLKVDNDFGKNTESYLKSFQSKEKLDADGVFGTKSLAKAKIIKK